MYELCERQCPVDVLDSFMVNYITGLWVVDVFMRVRGITFFLLWHLIQRLCDDSIH